MRVQFQQFAANRRKVRLSDLKKLRGGETLHLAEYNHGLEKVTRFVFTFQALIPTKGRQQKFYAYEVQGKSKTMGDLPLSVSKSGAEVRSVMSSDISDIYWDKAPSVAKKPSKLRPSPLQSATLFKVGTRKRGNDGRTWVVAKARNGVQRWVARSPVAANRGSGHRFRPKGHLLFAGFLENRIGHHRVRGQ